MNRPYDDNSIRENYWIKRPKNKTSPEQNVPKTKRPRYVGTLWSLFCFASGVWFLSNIEIIISRIEEYYT